MTTAPDPRISRATQMFQRGMLREADAECRQILSSNPADPEALHLLGLIAMRTGQPDAAIQIISVAIQHAPTVARFYVNRGEAYRTAGKSDLAEADNRRAIELDPSNATAHFNLGLVLSWQEKLVEAIESYRNAIRIKPDYAKAHFNLANTLRAARSYDEAEDEYRQTVAIDPKHVEAWNNLGKLQAERMKVDDALNSFQRAVGAKPDHARAQFNLGILNLLRGDYAEGWQAYEWRWQTPAQAKLAPRFAQPQWMGEDLAGKTILIFGEQGAGDCIQFVRYATLIAERGPKRVIVTCPSNVATLFQTIPGVDEVVTQGSPMPQFDTYIPMLSAPSVFKTTLQTIPNKVPYLFPTQAKIDEWRQRLAPHRSKLNVGLTWAGNPNQQNDANRSSRIDQLAPLAGLADTTIFAVQKGPALAQVANSPIKLVDLSNDLHDFMDTAAVLANLDVAISVCTSVAHIAGAMGRPTLAMLCYNADWRWLMHRDDSPWYPTMKLFRQPKPGDWEDVARRIRAELETRSL